jgi:hypothetical protein
LEPGRSLLSLAYFLHTDSYLWRHKSSTATEESIPDVRVDDKSAAVLFRWKRDQAEYEAENIKPSFLRALSWHFRHILLSQQLFAYFNAFGALLPPFFLQRIIGFISSRTGENPEPVHVALLYAFGMLGTQVFLAFSQSAVSNHCLKLCSAETGLQSVVATELNDWAASLRSAEGPIDYFDLHEITSQNWSECQSIRRCRLQR